MTPDATRRFEERAPEGEQIDDQTTAVRAGRYMDSNGFRQQFSNIADACALAQAIVDTVQEPLLVFDRELRVIAASRSFYSVFKVSPQDTQGRLLRELGDGQWDILRLRLLLEKVIPEQRVMEDYEVEHEFPGVGHRTMRLTHGRCSMRKCRYHHPAWH